MYIATGEQYLREANVSVESVRRYNPDIEVCMMTDVPEQATTFDHVISVDEPKYSFGDQIRYLEQSPFERSLYLDTDCLVNDDIRPMFDVLDNYDLGIVHSQGHGTWDDSDVPPVFPSFNSGVMLYRMNTRFLEFCDRWREIYKKERDMTATYRNEPSLRRAIYMSDIRVCILYPEFNFVYNSPGHAVGRVKIIHGRLADVDGPGAGRYFNPEQARRVINASTEPRVITQLGGLSVHSNRQDNLLHQARLSYRMHGAKHVIREGMDLLQRWIRSMW